ncbi:ATP-grasp domain-containing protein [Candidatus Pseudothioglobus singularis]|nr:ATP-grasp domain-containing protein [Candidatus Pseudothioglobus singularis]
MIGCKIERIHLDSIMKNNLGKSVVFLGVNDLQIGALIGAKSSGFICVGFDRNNNAKGRRYCDYFFNIDATDISALFSKINFLQFDVYGIWANNDILIPTRLVLSKMLGIKDTDIDVGIRMLDKLSFRSLVGTKNYFIPWAMIDVDQNESPLGYPVITKPVIGGGSQGVSILSNQDEFLDANKDLPILIEKYVEGYELGINAFYDGKDTHRLGAVYRYFNHMAHPVPIGTITEYDGELSSKAFEVLEDYISEINYYGMVKADILVDQDDNVYMLELSPRFHGEIDTEYVFSYLDYSIPKQYFKYLANASFEINPFINDHNFGYLSLFLYDHVEVPKIDLSVLPLGKFGDIDILHYSFHRYCGDKINKTPKSTYDIVVFSFFRSKNKITDDEFLIYSEKLNEMFNDNYD